MTLDEIVEETRSWPPEQLSELLDRLALLLHQPSEPQIDQDWKQEIRRRLADIEGGRVQGIPGEEVSARVRRIVGR